MKKLLLVLTLVGITFLTSCNNRFKVEEKTNTSGTVLYQVTHNVSGKLNDEEIAVFTKVQNANILADSLNKTDQLFDEMRDFYSPGNLSASKIRRDYGDQYLAQINWYLETIQLNTID